MRELNRTDIVGLSIVNHLRHYEVLEQSSQQWHDGRHDPWPAMNFLLFILTQACQEFERRVGQLRSPRDEKTGLEDRPD